MVELPPGVEHTFRFAMPAPEIEGSLTSDWHVQWFGPTLTSAVAVECAVRSEGWRTTASRARQAASSGGRAVAARACKTSLV